jgi:hypothetical protein
MPSTHARHSIGSSRRSLLHNNASSTSKYDTSEVIPTHAQVGVAGRQLGSQQSNGSLALSSQGSAGQQRQQHRPRQRQQQQRAGGLSLVTSSRATGAKGAANQPSVLQLTRSGEMGAAVTRSKKQRLTRATAPGEAAGVLPLQQTASAPSEGPTARGGPPSGGAGTSGCPSQLSWAAEYAPTTREELVIHKKKVKEPFNSLTEVAISWMCTLHWVHGDCVV